MAATDHPTLDPGAQATADTVQDGRGEACCTYTHSTAGPDWVCTSLYIAVPTVQSLTAPSSRQFRAGHWVALRKAVRGVPMLQGQVLRLGDSAPGTAQMVSGHTSNQTQHDHRKPETSKLGWGKPR